MARLLAPSPRLVPQSSVLFFPQNGSSSRHTPSSPQELRAQTSLFLPEACSLFIHSLLSRYLLGFIGDAVATSPPTTSGDAGSIPGSGRSPGEGNGNPLQYSHLENPRDRGAWLATVHGAAKESDPTEWLNNTCWVRPLHRRCSRHRGHTKSLSSSSPS